MIDSIGNVVPKYNQWVRMRLEACHMGASGDFFESSPIGYGIEQNARPGVRHYFADVSHFLKVQT